MKQNITITKGLMATVLGGVTCYLHMIAVPLLMLVLVMCIDYLTGMIKAWFRSELSSKVGFKGIVKKVCYLLVVCAAAVVDWLIVSGLGQVGITIDINFAFGVIVTIWLIINELISILENLTVIGVPMPKFLINIVSKLQLAVENNAEPKEENHDINS